MCCFWLECDPASKIRRYWNCRTQPTKGESFRWRLPKVLAGSRQSPVCSGRFPSTTFLSLFAGRQKFEPVRPSVVRRPSSKPSNRTASEFSHGITSTTHAKNRRFIRGTNAGISAFLQSRREPATGTKERSLKIPDPKIPSKDTDTTVIN